MELSDRAQSEVVGVVLLTAVIVVVTVVGVGILSGTDDRRDGESLAAIEITATSSGVGLEHRGRNRFDASRVSVDCPRGRD